MSLDFDEIQEEEAFRDRIATVNADGKRVWVYPKKPKGKWLNRRKLIAYFLLIFLVVAPFVKLDGVPFLQFDIFSRKFSIFFKVFWPQDFYLFAIALVIGIVFIIFFTIIFGRIFCGWFCPQTIFMEMVFRKIEYWIEGDWTYQKKLNSQPWNKEKIFKKLAKHALFLLVSIFVSAIFFAYIVGSDEVLNLFTAPALANGWTYFGLILFSLAFYGVFAFLREQVCTSICPYGRLQGVLLDKNSMVVAYDYERGENRAKFKKNEDRDEKGYGDCIDCYQCVHVCPTGIDIRNGTQLECINCTACIDACDTIMTGIGKDTGLIRFVSENGIKERKKFEWTKRVKSYTFLLIALIVVLIFMLFTRDDVQVSIFRQRGTTMNITADFKISNTYELNLVNKTNKSYTIALKTDCKDCKIRMASKKIFLKKNSQLKERFVVEMPINTQIKGHKMIDIQVLGNGDELKSIETKFIGPIF